jgi:hypothetical protein
MGTLLSAQTDTGIPHEWEGFLPEPGDDSRNNRTLPGLHHSLFGKHQLSSLYSSDFRMAV